MKFDTEEMITINNFFNWIKETLNNEERYIIGDSFIEDKKTGRKVHLDVGYGIEILHFFEKLYFMTCYEKNCEKLEEIEDEKY